MIKALSDQVALHYAERRSGELLQVRSQWEKENAKKNFMLLSLFLVLKHKRAEWTMQKVSK